jgi:hypothetical protein
MNETAQEQGVDARRSLKTLATVLVPGSLIVPATKDFIEFHRTPSEERDADYLSLPEAIINISLPVSIAAEAARLGIYYGIYKLIDYLV